MLASTYLPKINGTTRTIHDLSRKLVERGHTVCVLTRRLPGTRRRESLQGVRVIRMGSNYRSLPRQMSFIMKSCAVTTKILSEEKFDVIHCHGPVPGAIGLFGKLTHRLPTVVTFHSLQMFWPHSLRWRRGLSLLTGMALEKAVMRSSDLVTAQSKEIGNVLKLYGSGVERKIRTIPNGVDTDLFRPGSYQNEHNDSSPLILSVGGLARIKGFDLLIRAMRSVREKIPSAKLLIVGGGPQRPVLESLAHQLGLAGAVTFAGWQAWQSLPKYYVMSQVVVVPSIFEFFPLAILEAMAMAKPVVATENLGSTALIRDGVNGYLVKERIASQLAASIVSILPDPTIARRMGEAGRQMVEERFSLGRVAVLYEEAYRSALERQH